MIIFGGGMAKTGQPLIDVTLDELRVRERTCPFLTGLHLGERIKLAQLDQPVGALGAAWPRRRPDRHTGTGDGVSKTTRAARPDVSRT